MAYYEFEQAPESGLRLNGEKYMWLGTGDEAGTKYVKAAKGTSKCIQPLLPPHRTPKSRVRASQCLTLSQQSFLPVETMIISGSVSCVIVAVADKAQGQMFGQLIPAVTGLAAYLAESGY